MISNYIKRITPHFLYPRLSSIYKQRVKKIEDKRILNIVKLQIKALKRLKGKENIRCIFFALFEEVWKYDNLYKLMEESDRFTPTILVCPIVNYGRQNMLHRMNQCYDSFKKRLQCFIILQFKIKYIH